MELLNIDDMRNEIIKELNIPNIYKICTLSKTQYNECQKFSFWKTYYDKHNLSYPDYREANVEKWIKDLINSKLIKTIVQNMMKILKGEYVENQDMIYNYSKELRDEYERLLFTNFNEFNDISIFDIKGVDFENLQNLFEDYKYYNMTMLNEFYTLLLDLNTFNNNWAAPQVVIGYNFSNNKWSILFEVYGENMREYSYDIDEDVVENLLNNLLHNNVRIYTADRY